MKYTTLSFLIFITFYPCKGTPPGYVEKVDTLHTAVVDNDSNFEYPPEIIENNAQVRYDIVRWNLYCIYCDRAILFNKTEYRSQKVLLGTLPLKFDRLIIQGDTMQVDCSFYYNNMEVDRPLTDRTPYGGGIFIGEQDSLKFYSGKDGGASYFWVKCLDIKKCTDRRAVPEQPEVIAYIKKNRDKLDPWFRREAIRRGVISE